jgi:hypothetical protein
MTKPVNKQSRFPRQLRLHCPITVHPWTYAPACGSTMPFLALVTCGSVAAGGADSERLATGRVNPGLGARLRRSANRTA